MKTERDKFLTEFMGECWHDALTSDQVSFGEICGCSQFKDKHINFSTWEGFGILWEWVYKQDFYSHFIWKNDPFKTTLPRIGYGPAHSFYEFGPDKLADQLYAFLKEDNK